MSGKPSPEGANRVIEILNRVNEVTETIRHLAPEVHQKTVELKNLEEEHGRLQHELGKLMRSMDVDAPGNYGWEGRVTWLISEMHRQMQIKIREGSKLRE